MYKKILVPLDGSGRAETILPHVEDLARTYEATIVLLRVVEPVPVSAGTGSFDGTVYVDRFVSAEKDAMDYLRAHQIALEEAGFNVAVEVRSGIPVDAILSVVAEKHVDLVAMASHGRTGLGTVVFGSVASGVLNKLDKPLLLIRAWG